MSADTTREEAVRRKAVELTYAAAIRGEFKKLGGVMAEDVGRIAAQAASELLEQLATEEALCDQLADAERDHGHMANDHGRFARRCVLCDARADYDAHRAAAS